MGENQHVSYERFLTAITAVISKKVTCYGGNFFSSNVFNRYWLKGLCVGLRPVSYNMTEELIKKCHRFRSDPPDFEAIPLCTYTE